VRSRVSPRQARHFSFASPKEKYPKEKATLLVRRLRRFPKCRAEKRAKKNSPFLGLKAQTVLGQLFCLSVFQPRTLAQKKGWGEEYRVNVPLRGPSFLCWGVARECVRYSRRSGHTKRKTYQGRAATRHVEP
jgi:hypothetical protein